MTQPDWPACEPETRWDRAMDWCYRHTRLFSVLLAVYCILFWAGIVVVVIHALYVALGGLWLPL